MNNRFGQYKNFEEALQAYIEKEHLSINKGEETQSVAELSPEPEEVTVEHLRIKEEELTADRLLDAYNMYMELYNMWGDQPYKMMADRIKEFFYTNAGFFIKENRAS